MKLEEIKQAGVGSLTGKPKRKEIKVKDFLVNISKSVVLVPELSLTMNPGDVIYTKKLNLKDEDLVRYFSSSLNREEVLFLDEEELKELVEEKLEKGKLDFSALEDRFKKGYEGDASQILGENPFLVQIPEIDKRLEEFFSREKSKA